MAMRERIPGWAAIAVARSMTIAIVMAILPVARWLDNLAE
jgi:hypothetical protein